MLNFEYTTTFAVIMYFVPAIISLLAFFFLKKKFIWLAVPITALFDVIAFWDVITYYESQMLSMIFLIPQLIIVGAISFLVFWRNRKKKRA